QKRKSSRTRSVFWIMKMSSSPSPVSEAIAPPPSRRASAGGLGLSLGLSWTMTALSFGAWAPPTGKLPIWKSVSHPDHAVRQGRSGGENDPGKNSTIPSPNTDDQEVSSFSANPSFGRGTPAAWPHGLLIGARSEYLHPRGRLPRC